MGAFNVVTGQVSCPSCGRTSEFDVQFKFGDTWQHSYRVGEKLRWGGNDIGEAGCELVIVEGIGGPCPYCHADHLDFEVVVENDVLTTIKPAPLSRTRSGPEGFIVLKR